MLHNFVSLVVVASIFLVFIVASNHVSAQPMSSLQQNINAIYAVSIVPGAAQKDNTYHYYPPVIAVPQGTTVAWFNNDFGQPHTVTSGAIGAADSGSVFNSGIMPATANSFFQYTFSKTGDILYHCEIHPWRLGKVSTNNVYEIGHNFQISYGAGVSWDLTKYPRSLMIIKPTTVPLDKITAISYNITIQDSEDKKLFSNNYNTIGDSLPIEFISGGNETSSYGPDFSSTGAYHVLAGFLENDKAYKMTAELSSINYQKPDSRIIDEFIFKTVS